MSSTNRGGQRSPADRYNTPSWCVHRLLDRLELPTGGIWYEPCAGSGAIIQAMNVRGQHRRWWANEIMAEDRPELLMSVPRDGVVTIGDILDPGLSLPPRDEVTVVKTNPPFRIAWELLHKMLRAFPTAHIVLLLRLNFYGSATRHSFLSQCAPDIYGLPNRPGFKEPGKTDSPEYGWFVWPPTPRARVSGKHELLGLTPLEERKRCYGVAECPTLR